MATSPSDEIPRKPRIERSWQERLLPVLLLCFALGVIGVRLFFAYVTYATCRADGGDWAFCLGLAM